MIEILYNFVDWRKNIVHSDFYGINTSFDPAIISFADLKSAIFELFPLVPDKRLRHKLLLNDIKYESTSSGGAYEADFDHELPYLPRIWPRFTLSQNIIPKRGINNITSNFSMSTINHDLLVALSRIPGLTLMILYNPHYRSWENNKRPNSYKYKSGVKTYYCERSNIKKVDLSNRPGKITGIGNLTYHGGSEYWFGPSFYNKVPKQKILEFEHADLVQELPNDIVHIRLMDLKDYWSYESEGRLWDLKAHLEIDRLTREYNANLR